MSSLRVTRGGMAVHVARMRAAAGDQRDARRTSLDQKAREIVMNREANASRLQGLDEGKTAASERELGASIGAVWFGGAGIFGAFAACMKMAAAFASPLASILTASSTACEAGAFAGLSGSLVGRSFGAVAAISNETARTDLAYEADLAEIDAERARARADLARGAERDAHERIERALELAQQMTRSVGRSPR